MLAPISSRAMRWTNGSVVVRALQGRVPHGTIQVGKRTLQIQNATSDTRVLVSSQEQLQAVLEKQDKWASIATINAAIRDGDLQARSVKSERGFVRNAASWLTRQKPGTKLLLVTNGMADTDFYLMTYSGRKQVTIQEIGGRANVGLALHPYGGDPWLLIRPIPMTHAYRRFAEDRILTGTADEVGYKRDVAHVAVKGNVGQAFEVAKQKGTMFAVVASDLDASTLLAAPASHVKSGW